MAKDDENLYLERFYSKGPLFLKINKREKNNMMIPPQEFTFNW